jgi:acetolactate synthase-1/2/3 large subunit
MIDLKHASQKYIRCAGSMGWGFPGALGVKCAVGERPVVCWTGDGAFYYHIAELETAVRYGINLVVVVNNNSALNQEIPLVKGALRQPAVKTEELWDFQKIDFAKVAEALGCVGIRAETPAQVKEALSNAFSMRRPVIIDAVTDVNAFARRAWVPQGASSGH